MILIYKLKNIYILIRYLSMLLMYYVYKLAVNKIIHGKNNKILLFSSTTLFFFTKQFPKTKLKLKLKIKQFISYFFFFINNEGHEKRISIVNRYI